MQSDIVAIEQWARIFSHPTDLSAKVLNNWDALKRTITKDIDSQADEWVQGNYFEAGVDTADVFSKLL